MSVHACLKANDGEAALLLLSPATATAPNDLNAKDESGRTLLHLAAVGNLAAVCQALLDHPLFTLASVLAADSLAGYTALHTAAAAGSAECCAAIASHRRFASAVDADGRVAASALDARARDGRTALQLAEQMRSSESGASDHGHAFAAAVIATAAAAAAPASPPASFGFAFSAPTAVAVVAAAAAAPAPAADPSQRLFNFVAPSAGGPRPAFPQAAAGEPQENTSTPECLPEWCTPGAKRDGNAAAGKAPEECKTQ
jgi:hypothetical protein